MGFSPQKKLTRGYDNQPANYIPIHVVLPIKFEPKVSMSKLFQDVSTFRKHRKIMMVTRQQNAKIGQKTKWSIPCKSRTPSGPYTPL